MDSTLLYCDLYQGGVSNANTGGTYNFPTLIAGGSLVYALRFLEYSGSYNQVYPDIAAVRMAIGYRDARPTSGTYCLKASAGSSTGANTTATLAFGALASAVEAALNALSIATGNSFIVTDVAGGYVVKRTDGSTIDLTVINNTLLPISFGTVEAESFSGAWQYEVRLRQAPLAFTDSGTVIAPPPPTITEIQAGGTSTDGITKWNEIQQLTISPLFQGTYQIKLGSSKRTILLDITDGAAQLQDALNAIFSPTGGSCTVTNPTSNVAQIEFTGTFAGSSVELLTVSVYSAPPGDLTFTLNLGTVEMLSALRDVSPSSLQLPFEAEADFYIDPDLPWDGTITRKLWATTVIVQPPLIFPDLSAVPNIDWVRPPQSTSIPFTPDQIITGVQNYTQVIGDGSTTIFHITHGLGTNNISGVIVRQNVAYGTLLQLGTDYTLSFDSTDGLTLTFATAPAASAVALIVTSAGPSSAFEAHTHTIEQIVGLQTILDSYSSAISSLLTILPTVPSAGVAGLFNGLTIPLQPLAEIINYRGMSITPDSLLGLNDLELPHPKIFPANGSTDTFDRELWRVAVNDKMLALGRVLVVDWGVALQLLRGTCVVEYKMVVEIGTYADAGSPSYVNVAWNTGSPVFTQPIVLTAERTVHSFALTIPRGIVSASFAVTGDYSTNTLTAVGSSFTNGTKVSFGALTGGSGVTTGTTYYIIDASTDTFKVSSTSGGSAVALGTDISAGTISFGTDTLTLAQTIYGIANGNNSAAPSSANFAIRCRLINLETENVSPAKGWVFYGLVPSLSPIYPSGSGLQAVVSTT